MIIPVSFYMVFWAFLLSALVAGGIYMRMRRHNSWPLLALLLAVGAFFVCNQLLPNVYVVTAANEYKQRILIAPMKSNDGSALTLGSHFYVVNQSEKVLHVRSVEYGTSSDKRVDALIFPSTSQEVAAHSLSYIFTDPPHSISSKSDGEMKYWLYCESESKGDEQEVEDE